MVESDGAFVRRMAKSVFVQSELCIGVSGAAAADAAVLLVCPKLSVRFVDISLPVSSLSELRSRKLSGEEDETRTCEKNRDEDRIRMDGAGLWRAS